MRINSLLICMLLQAICVQAQPVRNYAPETAEPTARGIPAIFDMWGPLRPHWSGQALIGVQDNHSSGPLIYLIDLLPFGLGFGILMIGGLRIGLWRPAAVAR